MSSYKQDGKSGPWAIEKWSVLKRYLEAYTTVLKKKSYNTYFIDAFAGTGKAELREPAATEAPLLQDYIADPDYIEFLSGSALTALEISNPFSGYLFCEPNAGRARKLRDAISNHPLKSRIRVREEPAQLAIQNRVVNNPGINWNRSRAVCFLDPFALEVGWDSLEKLASTKSIEVILNFPLGMAIQRLLPNDVSKSEVHRKRLNQYFGTNDWFEIVYPEIGSLFGTTRSKSPDAGLLLLEWYRTRLRNSFGLVSSPRLVRNTRGTPLYHLIWAGSHPKGLEIADYILKMGDVSET